MEDLVKDKENKHFEKVKGLESHFLLQLVNFY